jgi:hypothetical protein
MRMPPYDGDAGGGQRVTDVFKAIENWASQSEDRARLLIILVWLLFGVAVVVSIAIMAAIILPGEFWSGSQS